MKVNQITIEGFRGFEEKVTIDLHPQVNVFVGVNGSGKTTVLDIIAKHLEVFIAELIGDNIYPKPKSLDTQNLLEESDINYNVEKTTNSITIDSDYTWGISKVNSKPIFITNLNSVKLLLSKIAHKDIFICPIITYNDYPQ